MYQMFTNPAPFPSSLIVARCRRRTSTVGVCMISLNSRSTSRTVLAACSQPFVLVDTERTLVTRRDEQETSGDPSGKRKPAEIMPNKCVRFRGSPSEKLDDCMGVEHRDPNAGRLHPLLRKTWSPRGDLNRHMHHARRSTRIRVSPLPISTSFTLTPCSRNSSGERAPKALAQTDNRSPNRMADRFRPAGQCGPRTVPPRVVHALRSARRQIGQWLNVAKVTHHSLTADVLTMCQPTFPRHAGHVSEKPSHINAPRTPPAAISANATAAEDEVEPGATAD
jgi:hypothetical protein